MLSSHQHDTVLNSAKKKRRSPLLKYIFGLLLFIHLSIHGFILRHYLSTYTSFTNNDTTTTIKPFMKSMSSSFIRRGEDDITHQRKHDTSSLFLQQEQAPPTPKKKQALVSQQHKSHSKQPPTPKKEQVLVPYNHTVTLQKNQSFSACLLIMDDNHRLSEWIAYHYHALPLEYLIVVIDPRSDTSPMPILNKFNDQLSNLTIEVWTDHDFFEYGKRMEYLNYDKLPSKRQTSLHRYRQTQFIPRCMRYLKSLNKTWTVLIDSDEYLQFNGPNGTYTTTRTKKTITDSVTTTIGHERQTQIVDKVNTQLPYRSVSEYGSIMKFLLQLQDYNLTTHCMQIPRLVFGSKPTVNDTKVLPFSTTNAKYNITLDTMRYRKHGQRDKYEHQFHSKPIVDLSRVDYDKIPKRISKNIHLPLYSCPKSLIDDVDAYFRINHYVGSWEAFQTRKDSRGEQEMKRLYDNKSELDYESDDTIRDWIDGFVDTTTSETAMLLLDGSGVVEKQDHDNHNNSYSLLQESDKEENEFNRGYKKEEKEINRRREEKLNRFPVRGRKRQRGFKEEELVSVEEDFERYNDRDMPKRRKKQSKLVDWGKSDGKDGEGEKQHEDNNNNNSRNNGGIVVGKVHKNKVNGIDLWNDDVQQKERKRTENKEHIYKTKGENVIGNEKKLEDTTLVTQISEEELKRSESIESGEQEGQKEQLKRNKHEKEDRSYNPGKLVDGRNDKQDKRRERADRKQENRFRRNYNKSFDGQLEEEEEVMRYKGRRRGGRRERNRNNGKKKHHSHRSPKSHGGHTESFNQRGHNSYDDTNRYVHDNKHSEALIRHGTKDMYGIIDEKQKSLAAIENGRKNNDSIKKTTTAKRKTNRKKSWKQKQQERKEQQQQQQQLDQ